MTVKGSSSTQVEALTAAQVLALPAMVSVWPTGAAAIGGISRPSTYKLAKTGTFPVEVITIQGKYYCRRSDLIRFLGLTDHGNGAETAIPAPPTAEAGSPTNAN